MNDSRVRVQAIEDFAAALRELRESVGSPPFREMSGRSGAISHTTLHEATKGNRLPSWGTTAEFVKACGADPAAFRERWEQANQAIKSSGAGEPTAATEATVSGPPPAPTAPTAPPGEIAGNTPPAHPTPKGQGRFRLKRRDVVVFVSATVGVAAALTAGVVAILDQRSGSGGNGSNLFGAPPSAALSPAACPVIPTNPPAAPPLRKGNASVFIGDITLPDCTHVGRGKTVTKVWRIKNIGKVTWKGYALRRIEPQRAGDCQTIAEVPVDDTAPGKMVDIRTEVLTPKKPGLCYVRFKMVDAEGRVMFPGSRPVNFQIIVD